jgi:hypothetical protein
MPESEPPDTPPEKKPTLSERVQARARALGQLGSDAVNQPQALPAKAHGWFRDWFRKVWTLRGGGLYACGVAIGFLILEIREFVVEDVGEFVAMESIFSAELISFAISFVIDTFVNSIKALLWPIYVATQWPPFGAIALCAAIVLFPRYLKQPIEHWLFERDKNPPV